MNGYKLLTDAARLIGIVETDEELRIIGLPLINTVISELGFVPITSLSESVGISSPSATQALLFGTAMLICNALGDEEGRYAMSQIYSAKRAAIKGRVDRIRDTIPKGDWE